MQKRKKILSILIKLLIGLGSFSIIYIRLKDDFTSEKIILLSNSLFSVLGIFCFLVCLFLIPVNWGIEAYKWKLITAPIQWISYKTATKSVYSGVCVGNLAPGRATEFLAKIIYFKVENRSKITVLHFVGGMFQLSVTIVCGIAALLVTLHQYHSENTWITYVTMSVGATLLFILAWSIYKINFILNFISKKVSKEKVIEDFNYSFSKSALIQLFGFSVVRYATFFLQFLLLLFLFDSTIQAGVLPAIAVYFLITTTIPMISIIEAAIRAAIALVVFKDTGISNSILALSSLLIWLLNIILPSIVGYVFLWKQNFSFKLFTKKQSA